MPQPTDGSFFVCFLRNAVFKVTFLCFAIFDPASILLNKVWLRLSKKKKKWVYDDMGLV